MCLNFTLDKIVSDILLITWIEHLFQYAKMIKLKEIMLPTPEPPPPSLSTTVELCRLFKQYVFTYTFHLDQFLKNCLKYYLRASVA